MKLWFFILIFLICACSKSQILFQNDAAILGVNVVTGDQFLGSGLSLVDYDGDGYDDITLATSAGQDVRFFKNTNGTFTEQTLNIPNISGQTKSVCWVDIDNDGDKDLFVTSNSEGNKLFENDGNLNFSDISTNSGMNISNTLSYGASWGDYNNDGYLDVFICNRSDRYSNILYENNGDNTFTDVSSIAGISSGGHESLCAAFIDYDKDGFQDIYIANDKTNNENQLYQNNGDGTFTDRSEWTRTDVSIDAMSTTIGDYNNDGWFDIYVTNSPSGNCLFENQGNGRFINVAQASGTSYNSVGWGAVFLDADNDTDADLYVSGSLDGSTPGLVSAAFYENLNNSTFQIPASAGFVGDSYESYSNAAADIDNDGLLDIVVNNGGADPVSIWKNQSNVSNNWLKIKLEGVQSNRDGIGSIIEVSINGIKQYHYTLSGEGYLSQNSLSKTIGIGTATVVDYVKVSWLSGIVDILNNVGHNQVINMIEGSTLTLSDENDQQVKLQRNPVFDIVRVESQEPIKKLELYSILGQKLLEINEAKEIDISQYQKGHYLLKITTINRVLTEKVIFQ
jgi:hypothetical protein